VSLYSAVNSHRTMRWQRRRDAERTAARLRLYFEHRTWRDLNIEPSALALIGGPDSLPLEYSLSLVAVNESETTALFVRSLLIVNRGSPDAINLTLGGEMDCRLEPGQRMSREVFPGRFSFDMSGGFVGRAQLATDDWIETPIERLDVHLLSAIDQHNSRGRLSEPPVD
jgi:hypothetical protein